jgi:hypothetical protein
MVEHSFDGAKGFISKNVALAEEFNSYLRNAITDLEMKTTEQLDPEHLMLWVKLSALYVFNFNLFGTIDKKLFKQLWDLNKKVICFLFCCILEHNTTIDIGYNYVSKAETRKPI